MTDEKRPLGLLSLLWSRRSEVLRAWLWFVGSLAVLIQLLIWARPFTDDVLTGWIASVTAFILRVTGFEGVAYGSMIGSSLGAVEIVRECTGVYPSAMYVAAVLAFPTGWRRKLAGIVLGLLSIQVVNVVRVISLAYIHKSHPELFETAHLVVWQSLIVFATVLIWTVWAVELSGERPRHAA
jgi:exosortase H (IPTLxxWG-CTERM-specific)